MEIGGNSVVSHLLILLLAYLIGGFTTGYYLTRLAVGEDIRDYGSGSVGATNVGRRLGRWGFVLTLAGDFFKGVFALLVAQLAGLSPFAQLLAAISAVVGHIFPCQLGFRGGKGVATALGALAVINPWSLPVVGIFTLICFLLSRNFVFSGLLAFTALPLFFYVLHHEDIRMQTLQTAGLFMLVLVVLFAHRDHLTRFGRKCRMRTS